MASFYNPEELHGLGLRSYGSHTLISKKASIYGASNISLGDSVRIDDFCVLSGNIKCGNYIHIASGVLMYGGDVGISISDYTTLSSRVAVYAVSDDYSGEYMTNPMIPEVYRNVTELPVQIGRHVIVGSGCTILPGVTVSDGSSIGAMSLVNKSTKGWTIMAGIPCRELRARKKDLLCLEQAFQNSIRQKEQH